MTHVTTLYGSLWMSNSGYFLSCTTGELTYNFTFTIITLWKKKHDTFLPMLFSVVCANCIEQPFHHPNGQAFIATSLFDLSRSALPIIVNQNSPSDVLFTD